MQPTPWKIARHHAVMAGTIRGFTMCVTSSEVSKETPPRVPDLPRGKNS